MSELTLTHVGGPTVLIETEGWTILSDPTFDPPGRTYSFGLGTSSTKLSGPAIGVDDLPPIDVVLLSHDHHADNLDDAGRALLPSAGVVVTTSTAEARLAPTLPDGDVRGLDAWDTTVVRAEGRPDLAITATPCRHGPPLSRPVVGHVVGFALAWEGQSAGPLWVTGDTVLYRGVAEVADRLDVDLALVHLGDVKFGLTGPVHYSMTAAEAVELVGMVRPRVAVPVHYEGWSHFHQGRDSVERELATASGDVRARFRFVELGRPESFTM